MNFKKLLRGYYWKCNNCSYIKDIEEEVICWNCGQGEMIFTTLLHYKIGREIKEFFGLRNYWRKRGKLYTVLDFLKNHKKYGNII